MAPAEHVERQEAVRAVVAVEEAALLSAVERDVGVVEIEHDLARRPLMCLEEQIDQQRVDLRPVAVDLVILRRMPLGCVLQPVQRALAGQRRAVAAQLRLQLARQHREGRVLAQLVVVVEVLVAQRQAEDALPDQRLHFMLDVARVAPVAEARREPPHQRQALVHLSQQQRPGVRRDLAARKIRHHRPPFHLFKLEQLRRTLCWHRGAPMGLRKTVAAQQVSQSLCPDAPLLFEKSRLGGAGEREQ